MISPINDNYQYEEIIKSSEAKPKIFKPIVLIPVPKFDILNVLTPNNLLNTFFAGKEKQDVIKSTQEYIPTRTTPITEESINMYSFNQKTSVTTDSTLILEVPNATTSSLLSTLNTLQYNQNLTNLESKSTDNIFNDTFIQLAENNTVNYNKILNIDNTVIKNDEYKKQLTIKDIKNRKKFHDITNYTYNIALNDSLPPVIDEIYTIGHDTSNQIHSKRKKRSFQLFFNSDIQVGKQSCVIFELSTIY